MHVRLALDYSIAIIMNDGLSLIMQLCGKPFSSVSSMYSGLEISYKLLLLLVLLHFSISPASDFR